MRTVYYDLSQTIENRMTVFPGDPEPEISPASGVSLPWRVTDLHLGTHTGTHIDAASHYILDGKTIDDYGIERFILPGIVIPIEGLGPDQPIESTQVKEYIKKIPEGGAILLRTNWDMHWGQELYLRHPYLSPETAESLASSGIGLLGIDALNVDSTPQETHTVHDILLGRNILIVENLKGLGQLNPGELYQFSFLPLALRRLDGSPVRAVAWKD